MITLADPTLFLVMFALSTAAPMSIGIIGSIGDREDHPNRGGSESFRQAA